MNYFSDKFPEEGGSQELLVRCDNCKKPQYIKQYFYYPVTVLAGVCTCGQDFGNGGKYSFPNLRFIGRREVN